MRHFTVVCPVASRQLFLVWVIAIVLAIVTSYGYLQAQTTGWTQYGSGPVLDYGPAGSWEDGTVFLPCVMKDGDTLRMWYTGVDNTLDVGNFSMGYAWSTDGFSWTRSSQPILSDSTGAGWNNAATSCAGVLRDGDTLKMWYGPVGEGVGYATSVDGIHWNRLLRPILFSAGPAGEWDHDIFGLGNVIKDGSIYKMWYYGGTGAFSPSDRISIGYATSPDGITWTKYNDPATTSAPYQFSDPVLQQGASGSGGHRAWEAWVMKTDTGYQMWYAGASFNVPQAIMYATSGDGIHWTKTEIPVLQGSGWTSEIISPSVIRNGNQYCMWFSGFVNGWQAKIGYATAPAPVHHKLIRVPQDQTTIQAGIDAANNGDTVLVAEGTYKENIRYRGKAIIVGSRYLIDGDTTHVAKTILDGSGSTKPDSASVVYFIQGEDTTSVLTGFTIRGGRGTKGPWSAPLWGNFQIWGGGGIFCQDAGARIAHNIIEKNRMLADVAQGAGICATGTGSSFPFLIVEGNRIRDNYSQGTSTTSQQWAAGGGLGFGGVEARVVDNIVERDTAIGAIGSFGGGVAFGAWASGRYPGGVFARNLIRANFIRSSIDGAVGAGLSIILSGPVTLQENTIEGNLAACTSSNSGWAEGGGVCITDQGTVGCGRKVLLNNHFRGNMVSSSYSNDGGGLIVHLTAMASVISGNEFTDNTVAGSGAPGAGGAISFQGSAFRLENSIFTRNSARLDGGALHIAWSPQIGAGQFIVNNTIVDNHAGSTGAGMRVESAPGLIALNTIFWKDTSGTGGEIAFLGTSPIVTYCDVQGGWAGEGAGNINKDPLFVAGDPMFNLTAKSPCIGGGIDSIQLNRIWYHAPACDIDGHGRHMPAGSQPCDIGAQEEQLTIDVPEAPRVIPMEFALEQNYPNPFNPTTTIKYSLPHRSHVTLTVFNVLGQAIATLVDSDMEAGYHGVQFDAAGLASGVYFYRLNAGTFVCTKQLLLIR